MFALALEYFYGLDGAPETFINKLKQKGKVMSGGGNVEPELSDDYISLDGGAEELYNFKLIKHDKKIIVQFARLYIALQQVKLLIRK
ncbi:hypothetical protein DCO58_00250 [Helicobacter saguini]|uniref:Uncharacterized protein n=1 Tax=Helicobacter saguini TaxID=1548018 RepID=A0A347VQS6_9HELI|nr:hypothetical protein [Helicobacter saguini]MWV63176.1 hypothetical protein [Helicobacter saguini]MWV66154.1 hypothetical protein [Helicobacter saguini]MWV68503.1 hypothetical protein [Helicobacter saguini]MWV71942.1 hypothetical protein [Helicobacter saguini]TLD95952.1 hypothetical protein LS64_000905 [Helicobacter saguini]